MFWVFGPEARGILAPQPGIEPAPPALEGEVLTTGPPETSPLLNLSHHTGKKDLIFCSTRGNL